MPTPEPDKGRANLSPPGIEEVAVLSRGVASAVTPVGGMTDTQRLLMGAVFVSMTGHPAAFDVPVIDPAGFATLLSDRTFEFRTRIVQIMVLLGLVVRPLPSDVAERITAFAYELGVEEGMLEVARRFAEGNLGLAEVDFDRNGYTAQWSDDDSAALHTSSRLATAWDAAVADEALAKRWEALERLSTP